MKLSIRTKCCNDWDIRLVDKSQRIFNEFLVDGLLLSGGRSLLRIYFSVLRRILSALLLANSCSCNLNAYGLVYCVPTSTTIVVVAIYGSIGGFRIVDDCRWEVKV